MPEIYLPFLFAHHGLYETSLYADWHYAAWPGRVQVGGFATLLVAVPASVASSWLLCLRLAFAIAHLGGHDVFEPVRCVRN